MNKLLVNPTLRLSDLKIIHENLRIEPSVSNVLRGLQELNMHDWDNLPASIQNEIISRLNHDILKCNDSIKNGEFDAKFVVAVTHIASRLLDINYKIDTEMLCNMSNFLQPSLDMNSYLTCMTIILSTLCRLSLKWSTLSLAFQSQLMPAVNLGLELMLAKNEIDQEMEIVLKSLDQLIMPIQARTHEMCQEILRVILSKKFPFDIRSHNIVVCMLKLLQRSPISFVDLELPAAIIDYVSLAIDNGEFKW